MKICPHTSPLLSFSSPHQLKIEVLVAGGADVTVTDTVFVPSDPAAVALVLEASATCDRLRHIASHADCAAAGTYDLVLDTCAEATALSVPRLGASELTLTGDLHFQSRTPPIGYPVLSVDNSVVKRVEDAIGSADGLMRALDHL